MTDPGTSRARFIRRLARVPNFPSPAGVLLSLAGLAFLVVGLAGLRGAHLERQRTGEGLAFLGPARALLGGGTLALLGAGTLWRSAARGPSGVQRASRALAVGLVGLVVAAAIIAVAVEQHPGPF
jgi:hypothetical protein